MSDELIMTSGEKGEQTSLPKKDSNKRVCSKKKKDGVLRKNPQAPRRFKSSYILFFIAKQDEIKRSLPKGSSVGDVSRKSSQLWKNLPPQERAYWVECAEQDKQRYLREKDCYKGPWQIPYKRAKKNPRAPKRPMSSFLYFSAARRNAIKTQNPNMKNTEISSILGEQWRNATEEERSPFIEMELEQRKLYKVAIEDFNRQEKIRKEKEKANVAAQLLKQQQQSPPPPAGPFQQMALPPPPPPPQQSHGYYPYYPSQPRDTYPQVGYTDYAPSYSKTYLENPFGNAMTTNCTSGQYAHDRTTGSNGASYTSTLLRSASPICPKSNIKIESFDDSEHFFTFDKDIFK